MVKEALPMQTKESKRPAWLLQEPFRDLNIQIDSYKKGKQRHQTKDEYRGIAQTDGVIPTGGLSAKSFN